MSLGGSIVPAIRFRRTTKDYLVDWRGKSRRAIDAVDFSVLAGSICALVGPNGSGKTTLLKIVAGLTPCSTGACEVLGRVGYAPDELALPTYRTPRDLLTQIALIDGLGREQAAGEVERVLRGVALTEVADRRVREFSKGMRQRLAVAQALLGSREVLVLDEPATGLDPRACVHLAEVLRGERAAGRTVLFSSHFLPQVEEIADQFVVLDAGRVVWSGGREELAARGSLRAVYMEEAQR